MSTALGITGDRQQESSQRIAHLVQAFALQEGIVLAVANRRRILPTLLDAENLHIRKRRYR